MARFSTNSVKLSLGDNHLFLLEEPFDYISNVADMTVTVMPFSTDLASIQWYLQWLVRKLGPWNMPAILHDYLLDNRHLYPSLTRKEIDQIFAEALKVKKVRWWRRKALYNGVRLYAKVKGLT